jgi:RNA polymerase sigma-70 factor (ECF subfamily)
MPSLAPQHVDAGLARALVIGRAAWPEVEVLDADFAEYLHARAAGGDPSALEVSDLYLACACVAGNPKALAAFDRVFLAPLPAIVARTGAPAHVGREVTQALRARLLVADGAERPRLASYGGRGSLAGWLRIAAVREASKVHRHERMHAALRAEGESLPATPEEAAILERCGGAFREAFLEAFRSLSAEDRLLLRLHFAQGLNLDRLAAALGFSRATAGRRVTAARLLLRDQTMTLLGQRLTVSPEEALSILAALRSHLEISFGALVTATEGG